MCYLEDDMSRRHKKKSHPPPSPHRLSHWALSDVGRRREANEDFFIADSGLGLYLVADGMGGHAGGSTASRLAADTVKSRIAEMRKTGKLDHSDSPSELAYVREQLDQIVRQASATIYSAACQIPELEGMGTTLTILLISGRYAHLAHVGDSRAYRVRAGRMEQLTEDHSLVNEQVRAGFITAEEAAHSRFRNIITRSVGFESEVQSDTLTIPINEGDVFLLCSDGLNSMVSDEKINHLINQGRISDCCSRLVAAANQYGGEDNITVIIVMVGRRGRKKTLK